MADKRPPLRSPKVSPSPEHDTEEPLSGGNTARSDSPLKRDPIPTDIHTEGLSSGVQSQTLIVESNSSDEDGPDEVSLPVSHPLHSSRQDTRGGVSPSPISLGTLSINATPEELTNRHDAAPPLRTSHTTRNRTTQSSSWFSKRQKTEVRDGSQSQMSGPEGITRLDTFYRAKKYASKMRIHSTRPPTSFSKEVPEMLATEIRAEIWKMRQMGMTMEEIYKMFPGFWREKTQYYGEYAGVRTTGLHHRPVILHSEVAEERYDVGVGRKDAYVVIPSGRVCNPLFFTTEDIDNLVAEYEARNRSPSLDESIDESERWASDGTFFDNVVTATTVEPSQRLSDDQNQEQAKNAAKMVLRLSDIPISSFWQKFTEYFAYVVFFTGFCVSIADLWRSPEFLQYKITAFLLGLFENSVLLGMWLTTKTSWYKKHPDKEMIEKKHQYAENGIHEVLLYALIITSVLGFATEKGYSKPEDAFGWVQLILVGLDIIDIIWNQVLRLYMLYKLLHQIQELLIEDQELRAIKDAEKTKRKELKRKKKEIKGQKEVEGNEKVNKTDAEEGELVPKKKKAAWRFAGALLPRSLFSAVGNIILFLYLLFMFGVQAHKDNFEASDYHLTAASGSLVVCICIFPMFSLALFLLANSYWAMEILISVNLFVGRNEEFQNSMQESYGATMSDSLAFAMKNPSNTKERLENIRKLSNRQKVLYGISEVPVVSLLFVWEGLIALAVYFFEGFNNDVANYATKAVFLLFIAFFNCHLFLLMLVVNIMLPILLIGLLFYPFTTILFFQEKFHKVEDEEGENDDSDLDDLDIEDANVEWSKEDSILDSQNANRSKSALQTEFKTARPPNTEREKSEISFTNVNSTESDIQV